MTLFTTGRGSVVGSAISPVIKVCANPQTARALAGDMDVNAGRILEGEATLDEVGAQIVARSTPSRAASAACPKSWATANSS
jgi:altronate hydrolase